MDPSQMSAILNVNTIKVAIILPAYNEEQTIAATIREFYQYLPEASIWVINNRSSDATEQT